MEVHISKRLPPIGNKFLLERVFPLQATSSLTNGQEHVEQCVVSEEREDDEVQRVDHPRSVPALGDDAVVHDLVPVLAGQDLEMYVRGQDVYRVAKRYGSIICNFMYRFPILCTCVQF